MKKRTEERAKVLALAWMLLGAGAAAESLGTISGVVFNAVTGAPLAGSSVTLSQADGAPLQTVVCDRQGRYIFPQLPAGYYLLKAGRANFATGRYGQKGWNRAGQVIALGRGAGFTAEIRLHRLGVITGTVLDENGEGMAGFPVHAVTANPNSISGRTFSAGVTDDRGVFRIVGLKPGRYYVASSAKQLEDGSQLLPTYYPGFLTLAESRAVAVEIDGETGGVQIQPIGGRLARLGGVVAGAARYPNAHATVTLFRDEESRETTADAQGQFAFTNLVPGRYAVVAELAAPHGKLAAYQTLDVYGDRESFTLTPAPSPEIRARVVDEQGAEWDDPQVVVFLSRIENGARTQAIQVARQRGAYSADGLMPGEWRFFVLGPVSSAVESISVDGKDALAGFSLMPGRKAAATIRLRREAGRLAGKVTDGALQPAPGVSVLCYPLDPPNRYRLGGFRSQRTNLLGEYRFAGLPEGDYLVFATELEDFQPDEGMEELKLRTEVVRVGKGSDLTHDLRVLD